MAYSDISKSECQRHEQQDDDYQNRDEADMMVPDHSIRISADRGGTFCDVYACVKPSLFCFSPTCNLLPTLSSSRDYPDPDNPRLRKELVVKLCASPLTAL